MCSTSDSLVTSVLCIFQLKCIQYCTSLTSLSNMSAILCLLPLLIRMCAQLCSLLRFFILQHDECLIDSEISHTIRESIRFDLISLSSPGSVSTASQKQVTCVSMDLVPSVQYSLRLLSPGSSPIVSAWIHDSNLARASSAPPQLA